MTRYCVIEVVNKPYTRLQTPELQARLDTGQPGNAAANHLKLFRNIRGSHAIYLILKWFWWVRGLSNGAANVAFWPGPDAPLGLHGRALKGGLWRCLEVCSLSQGASGAVPDQCSNLERWRIWLCPEAALAV